MHCCIWSHAEVINIVAVNEGPVVTLCKSGKVLLWAWKDLKGFDTVPRPLDHAGLKFVKIAVGKSHALALAETGQVGRTTRLDMHCRRSFL